MVVHDETGLTAVNMRDSMAYFIAAIRRIDEWKKKQTNAAQILHEARDQANIGFLKDPLSKSSDPEDLIIFLSESQAVMKYMIKFPSILKVLRQWFQLARAGHSHVSTEALRTFYADLAFTLVEARTTGIQRTYVFEVMRQPTMNWYEDSCTPMDFEAFSALIFQMAHLMTETSHIGEYLTFLSNALETLINYKMEKVNVDKLPSRSRRHVAKAKERKQSFAPRPMTMKKATTPPPPIEPTLSPSPDIAKPPTPHEIIGTPAFGHIEQKLELPQRQRVKKTDAQAALRRQWVREMDTMPYRSNGCTEPMHINRLESKGYPVSRTIIQRSIMKPASESMQAQVHLKCNELLQCGINKDQDEMGILLRRTLSRPVVLNRIRQQSTTK